MGAPTESQISAFGDVLLRVAEVAARLKVSTATVYKLAHSGALPFVRVLGSLRFREGDLAAFLASQKPAQR